MNKPTLLHPNQVPPGGYHYIDADTGFQIKGLDYRQVIRQAATHRKANHLPVPDDFEAQVLTKWCAKWGPSWCGNTQPQPAPTGFFKNIRRSIESSRVFRGTAALAKLLNKANLVSLDVMKARGEVCRACPMRGASAACVGCSAVGKSLHRIITRERVAAAEEAVTTPDSRGLTACEGCGCFLPAKVWLSREANQNLTPPAIRAKLPASCWVNQEAKS